MPSVTPHSSLNTVGIVLKHYRGRYQKTKQNTKHTQKNSDHKGSHQAFTGATLELKTKLLDKRNANYASTLHGKKWGGKLTNLGPCSQKINQVRQFTLQSTLHSFHHLLHMIPTIAEMQAME